MIVRKSGNYLDEVTLAPREGAKLYVYARNENGTPGALAALTDDDGQPIANPITLGQSGEYALNADSAVYYAEIWQGTRRIEINEAFVVGEMTDIFTDTLAIAENAAATATGAATAAQALTNFRLTLAEGVADFAVGNFFSTAESGTLRVYERIAGAPFYLDVGDGAAPLTVSLSSWLGDRFGGIPIASDKTDKKYRWFAGTVRQTTPGAGWSFISDAAHDPIGFNPTLSLSGSALQVGFGGGVSKVVTMLALPDEDYAAGGLVCGVSVGTTSALISFYAPFDMRTAGAAAVFGNFIEAGVDATATFDVAGGTITVTHGAISHVDSNGSPPSIVNVGLPDGNQYANLASCSKTGFVINALHPIGGLVNAVAVTTLNLSTSAAWNGTDTLTLTHLGAGASVNDVVVAPAATGHIPVLTGATSTTATVQFRDYAGTLLTGGTSPGIFRYLRGGLSKSTLSGQTKLLVRRSLIPVRATYVSGSGNIWLFALMEMA